MLTPSCGNAMDPADMCWAYTWTAQASHGTEISAALHCLISLSTHPLSFFLKLGEKDSHAYCWVPRKQMMHKIFATWQMIGIPQAQASPHLVIIFLLFPGTISCSFLLFQTKITTTSTCKNMHQLKFTRQSRFPSSLIYQCSRNTKPGCMTPP